MTKQMERLESAIGRLEALVKLLGTVPVSSMTPEQEKEAQEAADRYIERRKWELGGGREDVEAHVG